jgi:hypothetical protein
MLAMSEPKDLLLVNEQLRRSNRRWKTVALAACSALVLMVILSLFAAEKARRQTEAAVRAQYDAAVRVRMAAEAGLRR